MDAKTLALKMLEWGELKEKLAALEAEISKEVAELESTQTVGNVRASYSKGRGNYNREAWALDLISMFEPELGIQTIACYTTRTVTESVDWGQMIDDLSNSNDFHGEQFEALKEKHYVPGTPTVKLSILPEKK